MSNGKILGAKLLLEGKEVPFIGATITCTVGQASIAYIDVVPHQTINNVKPRTLAQIFVRDYNAPAPMEAMNYPYILAWEGEVFGFSFGKTPNSRQFSLSCIDKTSYWDNVVTYFFNPQQALGQSTEGLAGAGRDVTDSQKSGTPVKTSSFSTSSLYRQIFESALSDSSSKNKREDGTRKDFLDAFIDVYNSLSSINTFYKAAESRLRITERIRLHSSGKLTSLIKNDEARKWFEGIAGGFSGYTTLRSVIQDLMSIIFHDYVSIPFPAQVDSKNAATKKDPVQFRSDAKTKTIGSFVFKPNLYMMPPPNCNIFFPDEYSSFQYNRNFFQEPTRLIYVPELPRFQGAQNPVTLAHVYQPDSFNHFMLAKGGFSAAGFLDASNPLKVSEEYGYKGQPDSSEFKVNNNGSKREQQFLTNEEKMKGVFMVRQGMVPAATQFITNLTDEGKKTISNGVAKYLFFKHRFENRQVQITSHLKMSVVPGFPVLVLDDSDADQSIIAYCSSVTHRIYATEGGYTNVSLSYARTVVEQDSTGTKQNPYIIPPWFEESIFGSMKKPAASKAAKEEVDELGETQHVSGAGLSSFYASLLGEKGSTSTADATKEETMVGASRALLKQYRAVRSKTSGDIQAFIAKITAREYVSMRQAMKFLGAGTSRKDLTTPFVEFFGDKLAGKGALDEAQVSARRSVVDKYIAKLKGSRGFRG